MHSKIAGFTLLEVMIALAVISIALAAMVRAGSMAAVNTAYIQEKTLAHWIANNRLTELQAEAAWPDLGVTRDKVKFYGQEWEWVQTVSETSVVDMRRIDIAIALLKDKDVALANLTAFALNPALLQAEP